MRYTEETASRLYTYFIETLDMKENNKNWLVGDCPHCGKKKKFGINVHINMANCFVCGDRTSPLGVVKKLEGFNTFNEVYQLINKYEAFSIDLAEAIKPDKAKERVKIVKALPKEYKMVGLYDSKMEQLVRKQLKARGFGLTKAMMLGFGYCGTGEYAQRLIIPFYRNGKIIYFNSRSLIQLGAKYKNPSEEEFGIGKGHIIYNHDALNFFNKVWIFEGVLNAATIGPNATAMGGKQLSKWQINEVINSKCKRVVIALDDDAYEQAIKLALSLAPFKKVKILRFPKGKDANDLGNKATKSLEKQTPYLTYKQIYSEYIMNTIQI